MTAPQQKLVIGLGNDYRHDDAVGRVVARRLKAIEGDDVRVVEESGEGAALIEAWKGADFVILIDAVHSGGAGEPSIDLTRKLSRSRAAFSNTRHTHLASQRQSNWRARSINFRPGSSFTELKERPSTPAWASQSKQRRQPAKSFAR